MPTEERIELLLDEESAEEQDLEIAPQDPLGFRDSKSYADRLVALKKHTGQPDAFRSFLACSTESGFIWDVSVRVYGRFDGISRR